MLGCMGVLAACASAGSGGEPSHFSELNLGRRAPAPPPPETAPTPPGRKSTPQAAVAPPPVLAVVPVSPGEAQRRLDALLTTDGFSTEASGAAGARRIVAERMSTAPSDDAVCTLRALNRPQMYATTVDVQLRPSSAGVEVGVQTRFEEVDRNLVSGELSKHVCRSRGVLEAAIRRAALGG